jgi:hypothetical protein
VTFAGIPTAILSSGMSLTTTALAPIIEFFPIDTGPIIFAPALILTLSPIIGYLLPPFSLSQEVPNVTP